MPELENERWERFAQLCAIGDKHAYECYIEAGFNTGDKKQAASHASKLKKKPEVAARISELEESIREKGLEGAGLTREYVIDQLRENVEMAKLAVPITDKDGNPTGEYKQNLPAANKALELLGKEVGMFKDVLALEGLDEALGGMSGEQLRAFVKAAAGEVGLRCIEMTDDELRTFILRNAARVGLHVTSSSEDPGSAEAPETGGLPPVH